MTKHPNTVEVHSGPGGRWVIGKDFAIAGAFMISKSVGYPLGPSLYANDPNCGLCYSRPTLDWAEARAWAKRAAAGDFPFEAGLQSALDSWDNLYA